MTGRISRDLLHGDLSEQNLAEFLQFIQRLGRDGQVLVETDGSDGLPPRSAGIYFEDGRITHAHSPPFEGEPALFHSLGFGQGRFVFLAGTQPAQRTIEADFRILLLEGARRLDEERRLWTSLPSPGTVLYRCYDTATTEDALLPYRAWRLLELVDGQRSLQDIIHRSQREALEALTGLRDLLLAGIVTTVNDTRFLAEITLRRLPPEARQDRRPRAPEQLGRHVLRHCDGDRSLRELVDLIGCTDHDIVIAAGRLVRDGWAEVGRGWEAYRNAIA